MINKVLLTSLFSLFLVAQPYSALAKKDVDEKPTEEEIILMIKDCKLWPLCDIKTDEKRA